MHLQIIIYQTTQAFFGLPTLHCKLKCTMEGMMQAQYSSGSMTAECFKATTTAIPNVNKS